MLHRLFWSVIIILLRLKTTQGHKENAHEICSEAD